MNWEKIKYNGNLVTKKRKKAKKKVNKSNKLTIGQQEIAKDFRDKLLLNATEAEKLLLPLLRSIKGMRFQQVVCVRGKMYFPDFTFSLKHGKKLYVEIDGGYHSTLEQQEKDYKRTKALCRKGNRLIRFTNDEVAVNPKAIVAHILKEINAPSIS